MSSSPSSSSSTSSTCRRVPITVNATRSTHSIDEALLRGSNLYYGPFSPVSSMQQQQNNSPTLLDRIRTLNLDSRRPVTLPASTLLRPTPPVRYNHEDSSDHQKYYELFPPTHEPSIGVDEGHSSRCEWFMDLMNREHQFLSSLDKRTLQEIVLSLAQDGERLAHAAREPYGVKFIKKLILRAKMLNLLPVVASALQEHLLGIMVDSNACSLVSFCLTQLDYKDNLFLFEAAAKNCSRLARNEIGRFSLNTLLRSSQGAQRRYILQNVSRNSLLLAKTSKGNFTVQSALTLGDQEFDRQTCRSFSQHLEEFSLDQYGSYVLQACFKSTGREFVLRELVQTDRFTVERIATDRFGNFVLQTAIQESRGTVYHDQLVGLIREIRRELENDMYAKHVVKLVNGLL